MPIRLLRPGLTTSKRFNRLDWIAQAFYVRLLTQVDDFGRFEADRMLLRSACFPLGDSKGSDVSLLSIDSICQQMTAEGLAVFYKVGDTDYLQLTRWKERARSESRYPGPVCAQMTANDSNCQQMNASPPSPSPSPSPSPRESQTSASLPLSASVRDVFEAWNAAADNVRLPKCLLVSDKRRRLIEQRLRDPFFVANWRDALAKIGVSEFCHGVNERGWRASFEWFVAPDAVQKIMEGKYDNRSKASAGNNPRLAGVSQNNKVNNYAELAKRKMEREVAQAEDEASPKVETNGG